MAITKKTINNHIRDMNAPDSKKRSVRVKTDMQGLYLVITNKGKCTWTLIYSFSGKQISFSFAHYDNGGNHKLKLPVLTERQAYDMTIALKADIDAGINIKEEYVAKQQHQKDLGKLGILAKVDEFTVNDVFEYFMERVANKRWRESTAKNLEWSYNRHVRPHLGSELWDSVTFQQWRELFDGIVNGKWTGREAPTAARELAKSLKQAFDEALYAERVRTADIKSIKLSRIAPPAREGDRTLNEYELGRVWDWCLVADSKTKLMTKILLSTSARTHEVRMSGVEEWDLTTKVWTVPGEHSKNGDRIVRPIPEHLIDDISMQLDGVRFMCEGMTEAEFNAHPMMGKIHSRTDVANEISDIHNQLGLAKFTAHDLRRTCSTIQHEIGMEHIVIESLMGHRMDKVRRTYNHSTMLDGKRDVLAKWHDHLELCREKYLEIKASSSDLNDTH